MLQGYAESNFVIVNHDFSYVKSVEFCFWNVVVLFWIYVKHNVIPTDEFYVKC